MYLGCGFDLTKGVDGFLREAQMKSGKVLDVILAGKYRGIGEMARCSFTLHVAAYHEKGLVLLRHPEFKKAVFLRDGTESYGLTQQNVINDLRDHGVQFAEYAAQRYDFDASCFMSDVTKDLALARVPIRTALQLEQASVVRYPGILL